MKKYIIINGKNLHFINQESIDKAITYAQNYMNHSEEVIVREFTNIFDASHLINKHYENI